MTDREEAPSISFPAPPEFLKVDRSTMGQLVVETELCQLILSRVLEVIRQRDVLPFTISTRRNKKVQIIEMELVALPQPPALAILQDLRRLSNVRVARFLLPANEGAAPAVPAKA